MLKSVVAVIAVVALALTAGVATGAPRALPIVAMTPDLGTLTVEPGVPVPLSVTLGETGCPPRSSYQRPSSLFVEVSTQNVPGQNGTLADDYVVAMFSLARSDADPFRYQGSILGRPYKLAPGNYYLQAYVIDSPCGSSSFDPYNISPVFNLTVVAPAPPPPPPPPPPAPTVPSPAAPTPAPQVPAWLDPARALTLSQARRAVAPVLRSKFKSPAASLKRSCRKTGYQKASCVTMWQVKGHAYVGTLTLKRTSETTVRYDFLGNQTKLSCLRTKSMKVCNKRHRFQGVARLIVQGV